MNPNSAAARRRQQAIAPATNNGTEQTAKAEDDLGFTTFENTFDPMEQKGNQDMGFSTASNPFASVSSKLIIL